MRIEHNQQGYRGFCFRCKETKREAHGLLSIAQIQQRRVDELTWRQSKTVSLPMDYTVDLPDTAMTWLLKGGVSQVMWQAYKVGFSPKLNRVCIPVYRGTELVAVQMRAIEKDQKPKYLARETADNVIFSSLPSTLFAGDREQDYGYDLVVTEDLLSAIRVGRITASSAILGTMHGPNKMETLLREAAANHAIRRERAKDLLPRIALWMDPDKAGEASRSRIAGPLSIRGAEVVHIRSARDPKRHSNAEIRSYLRGEHDRRGAA
jgi:DNA primase